MMTRIFWSLRALLVVLLVAACSSGADSEGRVGEDVTDTTPGLPDISMDTSPGADDIDKPDAPPVTEVTPPVDVPVTPDTVDPGPGGCDDADPCTYGDRLVDGVCVGTPYTCDDGKECTEAACDGRGGCIYTLLPGYCFVRGVCAANGESPVDEPCVLCDVEWATDAWVELSGDCDDGDLCTMNNRCEAGACVGDAVICDDENPCTTGVCLRDQGCVHTNNALLCDDGDVCTLGDVCVDGECVPGVTQLDCDDGNLCTANWCDPVAGCQAEVLPDGTECDDGDACTLGDRCEEGVCVGPLVNPCDDGNSCTINSCDPISGCQHLLDIDNPCCTSGVNPCDDGNPCTRNDCNLEDGSCTTIPLDGEPCDDGDVCTAPGICDGDFCVLGPALDCDDGNPCTVNTCAPRWGCRTATAAPGSPCEHPDPCYLIGACDGRVCVADRLTCTECPPPFVNPMNIVTALVIGTDGHPGSGLDVDGNPDTCAPGNNCSGGVDNQFAQSLGILGAFIDVNATLADAVAGGDVNLLLEHRGPVFDGTVYTVAAYVGERVQSACDPATAVCPYRVMAASLVDDPPCEALIRFDNARITDGLLEAGGPASRFGIAIPFIEGVLLELSLYNARLQAQVVEEEGVVVALTDGLIAGAIRQQEVRDIIMALPDELFEGLPVDRTFIVTLLPSIFVTDIDTTGDGRKDATSIGLKFSASAATATEVTE